MSTPIVYVSSSPEGSHTLLHSVECAVRWAGLHPSAPLPAPRKPLDRPSACAHCAWCSHITMRPTWCAEHEDDCPDLRGALTDAYGRVVRELAPDFDGELPEAVWEAINGMWEPLGGNPARIIDAVREAA